jgi:4-hydroxy-4-methyl-2-oxoglutarate aldolase
VLVDAAVRDREEIERLGLPVWARWVHAAGADKLDPGEIDRPVTIGGVQIAPGDVIVLDADGVVVVERAALQATLAATELRFGKEEMLRGRLETGELTLDLMGLRRRDDATA